MVVEHRTNWGRIAKQIGRPMAWLFLLAVAVTVLNRFDHPFRRVAVPDQPISIIGAALGILLGFRTNTAYARWWEARTLWGGLVNSSRTWARQVLSFPAERNGEAWETARKLVYHQIAYVHALRCHLRRQEAGPEIARFLDAEAAARAAGARNVPAALLVQAGELIAAAAHGGIWNEWRLQKLDETLTTLTNIQGGCERIKNTPLPRQYDHYPELFVKAYCALLPFVLVDELGLATPFAVAMAAFVFLVLNRIGKNLEDPFENRVYDTPLSALSLTIEIDLRQALGETSLPAGAAAVDGVLW